MANTHLPLTITGKLFDKDIDNVTEKGPIQPTDVYNLLGVAKRSDGYNLNYINSNAHGRTDMWAKFKPEDVGGPMPITITQRKNNNFGLRVKNANSGQYGIVGYQGATMNTVGNLLATEWTYQPPTGWMRISDWLGYDTQSVAPMVPPGDLSLPFGQNTLNVSPRQVPIITSNLDISDFGYAEGKYLCVLIWKDGSSNVYFLTSSAKISSTDAARKTVAISENDLKSIGEQMNYLMCLSSAPHTSLSASIPGSTFWPLPCDTPPTGTITVEENAPLKFDATFLSAAPTPDRDPNSLTHYSMSTIDNGIATYHCLGLGLSQGTITVYGKFTNPNSTSRSIRVGQIQATLQHTLRNDSFTVIPDVYAGYFDGEDDSPYDPDDNITIVGGGSRLVTIVCNQIGFGGGTPTRDYQLNTSLILRYAGNTSQQTYASMGSRSINISKDVDRDVTIGMGLTPIN